MIDSILTQIENIINNTLSINATRTFPTGTILTSELPFCMISWGRASYTKINSSIYKVNRQFYIDIYLSLAKNFEREFVQTINDAVSITILETLFDHFMLNNRLAYNGSILNGVTGCKIVFDEGIGFSGWNKETYSGTRLTIEIEYIKQL